MTVPKEVTCPMCKNKMFSLNKDNPALEINALALEINGKNK